MVTGKRRKSNSDKADRVALRISPKDKLALELLARKKGITLSALVMNSLEEPLKVGLTVPKKDGKRGETVYIPDAVYDPLIPDRIVRLALTAPELLTDREQVTWKVIRENPSYMDKGSPNFKMIRDRWDSIQADTDELLKQHSL